MTLREALTAAAHRIALRDAETLLTHLLGRNRAYLLAHPEAELTATDQQAFKALTARRAAQEPMQHLTGQQEFFGLTLRVTPDTLIPRPETELLVEAVLDWLKGWRWRHYPRILDVGTGTGAIALALAKNGPAAWVTATDISAVALQVARENAERCGLDGHYAWDNERKTPRVRFLQSDLLTGFQPIPLPDGKSLPVRFDVIVSNPPYVPLEDAPTLAPEVRDHEPHTALFAGPDGLDIYRQLIPAAHAALSPGGLLALEFGFGQRDELRALFEQQPGAWRNLHFLDDYAGIPRVALAESAF